MTQYFAILDTEDHNTGFDIIHTRHKGGQRVIVFDLIVDDRGRQLPIPLRDIPHGRLPSEFEQYRRQYGVYIIVDAHQDVPLYVGESHSQRLIHTATRHVQSWDLGPSWNRDEVQFGFIVCADGDSAFNLQNLIIAEFILNGVTLLNNTEDRPVEIEYDPDDPPF